MKYFELLFELHKLRKNLNKTELQIKKLQKKKLDKILIYAYDHSDYYRRTFNEAGIHRNNILKKQIVDFPTVDKKKLIEHFDELITIKDVTQEELRLFDETQSIENKQYRNRYQIIHSSGSTGKPAYYLYDKESWNTVIVGIVRAALWNMSVKEIITLIINKPRILYIAATDGRYGGAMAVGDGVNNLKMEQMHLNIQSPLNEWINQIKYFKPNVIIGYPSAIKILAELINEGNLNLNIKRVITCGEPLHEMLQELFATVFKCEIVNVYGASESLAMGAGITSEKGITLFDDLNFIEIYEDEIYLTCLYNKVQPLIRYKLSDKLQKLKDEPDENPFSKVDIVLSRNEDILWFEDEVGNREFIHPLSVEGICVEGLLDYQFKKVNKSTFEMFAEIVSDADKERIREEITLCIQKILAEKELFYVKFYIEFVEAIKIDSLTGKKKLVLN